MRCIRCNRPLLAPAVSVPTHGGLLAYGPVCARKAGLLQDPGPRITYANKSHSRPQKQACRVAVVGDDLTIDMFSEGFA